VRVNDYDDVRGSNLSFYLLLISLMIKLQQLFEVFHLLEKNIGLL